MAYSIDRAIADHESEIQHFQDLKRMGRTVVSGASIGDIGRKEISVDEAIEYFQKRLEALKKPGANPEDFNY